MSNNTRFLIIIILTSFFSFSCSKKLRFNNFFNKNKELKIKSIEFDNMAAKVKIRFNEGEKKQIATKANVRVKNDSVIWISITVLGIQAIKCLISKQSITIMNSIKKEYYVINYNQLSKLFQFDVNYSNIESLLLGNPIKQIDLRKHKVLNVANQYLVNQNISSIQIKNSINANTLKIEALKLLDTNSTNSINVDYSNFKMVDDQLFPFIIGFELSYQEQKNYESKIEIRFDYQKVSFDVKKLAYPFNIPKKYEKK